MGLAQEALALLRSPSSPTARKIRSVIDALFRAEVPTTGVHALLGDERLKLNQIAGHLVRAAYYQPLLRAGCRSAGSRLLLAPGTGTPLIYGVDVVLGDGVALSGLTTIAGARRNDGVVPRFIVGNDTHLGHVFTVTSDSEVVIGRNVRIANNVFLCGYDAHPLDPIARRAQPGPVDYTGKGRIVIEDDVCVGEGTIILKGVTVGRGAVVQARSVVTRNVSACTIVAGNPAKPVGTVHATVG